VGLVAASVSLFILAPAARDADQIYPGRDHGVTATSAASHVRGGPRNRCGRRRLIDSAFNSSLFRLTHSQQHRPERVPAYAYAYAAPKKGFDCRPCFPNWLAVAERCPLPPPPVSAYSSLRALQFRSVPIGLNMVDHLSHVFSNRVQREKVKHYGLVDGAGLNYTKPMPCIEPDFLVKPAQSTTLSLPWTTRV
jgi:hypothetical protein